MLCKLQAIRRRNDCYVTKKTSVLFSIVRYYSLKRSFTRVVVNKAEELYLLI